MAATPFAAAFEDGRLAGESQRPVVELPFQVFLKLTGGLITGGRVGFQVENALASSGAAWGLGLPPSTIRSGLETFDSEPDLTPGRFNVLDAGGATVIVDFGHNPSAIESLVASLDAFEGRRRTVVLSADGDRRDEVIVRQAELLAKPVAEPPGTKPQKKPQAKRRRK